MSEWQELRILAAMYDDMTKTAVANTNRAKRGAVDPEAFAPSLAAIKTAQEEIGRYMRKSYKALVPLAIREWQAATPGIGDHLLARLLGTVGHPVQATRHHWRENDSYNPEQPPSETNPKRILVEGERFDRTLYQWWSYCGLGDAKRKRTKGMSQDEALALGNPRAKSLAYLMAESSMKMKGGVNASGAMRPRSPYRDVYEEARALYDTRVDEDGKPWSDAHSHNAAMRKTAKEILRDLWEVARDA